VTQQHSRTGLRDSCRFFGIPFLFRRFPEFLFLHLVRHALLDRRRGYDPDLDPRLARLRRSIYPNEHQTGETHQENQVGSFHLEYSFI
jgi:hypothetical protein